MKEFPKSRWWWLIFFAVYACSLTGDLLLYESPVRAAVIHALVMGGGVTLVVFLLSLWRRGRKNSAES